MKIEKLVWVAALLLSTTTYAQQYAPSPKRIYQYIDYLADDRLEGRGTGTVGGTLASAYVAKQFKKLKLKPAGTQGYFQPFSFDSRLHKQLHSRNVIGFIDNGAAYTIVIGAHYDHLGKGELFGDRYPNEIHNGADDNASGVAGLLELARYFKKNKVKEPFNFLFVAFGGEELGLHGSKHYVTNPIDSLNTIHFMLNMDMIGRYDSTRGVGIGGYGTAQQWPDIFKDVTSSVKFFTDGSGKGGSDHHSFYVAGVPVLFFHTGGHDDYHKPGDDVEKVQIEAQASILKIAIQLIENAMKVGKLTYVEQK
jgi:hypothetical protein